jgi:hypothetical protein
MGLGSQLSENAMNTTEIRAELFDEWNRIRMEWNDHLYAHRMSYGLPHPNPCPVCLKFEGRLEGVNCSIRRFGGRGRQL